MEDYVGLFRDFEIKKTKVNPIGMEEVTFSIPASLLEIFKKETGETLTEAINQTLFVAKVRVLKGNKLRLDHSIMRSFFDRSVRSVLDHLQTIHEDLEKYGISMVLLVCGFAESPMLSTAIRENCSTRKVLVPDGAGLVVLKGAALSGHDQSTIVYRVARYTYGLRIRIPFIDGVHPVEKLVEYGDGRRRCRNIFEKFLEEGSLVKYDQIVYDVKGFRPTEDKDNFINISIYASTDKDTKFTTDDCCFYLGHLRVTGLDTSIARTEREVAFTIIHKGTDLHLHAIDKRSGRNLDACIDLLD